MNGISSYVVSLAYNLPEFSISISVTILVQLYSICYRYWIFAPQEKRSATALKDTNQRCWPAGDYAGGQPLATTCLRPPAEALFMYIRKGNLPFAVHLFYLFQSKIISHFQ
jgi:hypothetical protein